MRSVRLILTLPKEFKLAAIYEKTGLLAAETKSFFCLQPALAGNPSLSLDVTAQRACLLRDNQSNCVFKIISSASIYAVCTFGLPSCLE